MPLAEWNFADVWEAVADAVPDRVAHLHGGRTYTWAEFGRRADGVAAGLLAAGLGAQDAVALDLRHRDDDAGSPAIGANTDSVLRALGLDAGELERLHTSGIVHRPEHPADAPS